MPRTLGIVVTAATTEVALYNKTYNEQTTGAQRSLKSASANDTALGTGIRSVRIIYYKLGVGGAITGPFVEVVAMNGASAAPTVATDIALIEKMEAASVGSGGKAAGDITLYSAADGTGTAIAILGQDDVQTLLAHHYVASGKTLHITDVQVSGGFSTACRAALKRKASPFANAPALFHSGPFISSTSVQCVSPMLDEAHTIITGPARVRLEVTPGTADAQLTVGSFGWYER